MKAFLTQKRNIGFLFLTVILLSFFSWFVISIPPTTILSHIFFYLIVFGISFSFLLYVFARIETAIVLACGMTLYFFLRFLQLRHPIYTLVLFICSLAVLRLTNKKGLKKPNE